MGTGSKTWLICALPLLAMLASGCYAHNHIRPTELPRLNGMSSQSTTRGDTTLVVYTVQNVTRTDGTIVQIPGEFSATVVPRDPSRPAVSFAHPVDSSVDGPNLTVAGGNRAAMQFPLNEIDFVDIATYDNGLSLIWWIAGGLLAGGLVGLVTFAAIN